MSDDLRKKYKDGWTVNFSQPHEVIYFYNSVKSEFPYCTEHQVKAAIEQAKEEVTPSEGREKLKEHVRKILRGY